LAKEDNPSQSENEEEEEEDGRGIAYLHDVRSSPMAYKRDPLALEGLAKSLKGN
jgi:hypothetical protein